MEDARKPQTAEKSSNQPGAHKGKRELKAI
jgi:hypothetical protein